MGQKKITIAQVAEQYELSTRTIRRYIADGRLDRLPDRPARDPARRRAGAPPARRRPGQRLRRCRVTARIHPTDDPGNDRGFFMP